MLIIMLLIYTALYVPYKTCFVDKYTDTSFIVDLFIDACFLTDIVLTFFTTIETENGQLVTDKRQIAIKYLKGWFTIDLLTSIPFQILEKMAENDSKSVGG